MGTSEPRGASPTIGLGIGAVVAAVAGPLLAHGGLVPPRVGFLVFVLGGAVGLLTVVVGLVRLLRYGRRGADVGLGAGFVVAAAFVVAAVSAGRVPPINDIATDPDAPLAFVTAPSLPANAGRDMRYPGPAVAAQQRDAYPDIVPLRQKASVDDTFRRIEAAVRWMPGVEITRIDPTAHAIEAVVTTWLFRFEDDVIVEVRPDGDGSVVQMRSKSREGRSDLGTNAARIRAVFARLSEQARGGR